MSDKSAKELFQEFGGDEEKDPLERLRFFCSLSMSGQDWIDAEPFFNHLREFENVRRWAFATEDQPETEWQKGYDAARAMVRCLLPAVINERN